MTLHNILATIFTAGLPLFLLSFALVSLALHRDWLAGETVQEIQDSIDALGKAQKDKNERRKMDPALGKWFSFGGGFYGLVALYTWLQIEWEDVANFLQGLGGVLFDMDPGAVFGLVIELFVESIMNFVTAIGWPAYWLAESRSAWIMLFAAYAGYWLGIKAAQYAWQRGWTREAVNHAAALIRRRN
jgi:hypothetical protein